MNNKSRKPTEPIPLTSVALKKTKDLNSGEGFLVKIASFEEIELKINTDEELLKNLGFRLRLTIANEGVNSARITITPEIKLLNYKRTQQADNSSDSSNNSFNISTVSSSSQNTSIENRR